ncbi:MAG: hypothetical protein H0U13_13540, partial [Gemmatimonadaceae bacterium]|nr:hypothetical protein [Gemmatimonadaceae bacterium]
NSAASLAEFAEVKLQFKRAEICPGTNIEVGSQRRFITAPPGQVQSVLVVTGANKIDALEINALEPGSGTKVHTRLITLGYSAADEDCSPASGPLTHAPVRLLTSIQESAWGTDSPRVDLPANTFAYGPSMLALVDANLASGVPTPWAQYANLPGKNFAWGYRRTDDRWPTVEAMLLDVDGDGLSDRLHNASVTENGVTSCKATWQRNDLNISQWGTQQLLTFGDSGSTRMPRLRWQGPNETGQQPNPGSEQADPSDNFDHREGCALNGQVTAFHNSHPTYGICHDNTACTPGSYCPDGNVCPDGSQPNNRTYLAYRWMDMDGDGLTDLVAAIHGNNQRYDIVLGNDLVGGGQPYEPSLFGTIPIPSGLPACAGLPELCKALGTNCMNRIGTLNACDSNTVCRMDWSDINSCVSTAVDDPCEMEIGLRIGPVVDDGKTPQQPGMLASARRPYRMCNGVYPWFIFKNRGNGNFSDTPIIKYQPVPLESDTGDSALTGPGIAGTRHGVVDIDGDGLVDGVAQARDLDQTAHSWWWYVWLNDGTGGLGPTRFVWQSREHALGHINGIDSNAVDVSDSSMGLFDVNGDGLVDHWHANPDPQPEPPTANIALNDGTGFQLEGPIPFQNVNAGEVESTIKPGSESRGYALDIESQNGKVFIISGSRFSRLRPFDIDADGRVDMFFKNDFGAQPELRFNVGGNFATAATPLPFPVYGVEQTMSATLSGLDRIWELKTDLVDLDDDGYAEGAYWIDGVFHRALHDVATTGPLRLLKTVDNGRGAVTSVAYAPMHDASASDPIVEQNPDEFWAPGRPKASPRNQWVVKSVRVVDGFANTDSTTGYRYKNPRFNADDDGRYAFRGFEEVRTIAPTGMVTKKHYGYDPDWSGRLETTLVVPAEAPNEVRSIDKTTWEARTLSGTSLTTYHATLSEHFVCKNGQGDVACSPTAAGAYTRTESTLIELPISGNKLLWQETGTVLKKQVGNADGDRETIRTFQLLADGITYRARPRTTTLDHRVNGSMTMYAKSDQTWDPTLAANLTNETWFDGNDANRAISRNVVDMTTGNVLERWKPVQNAAASTRTTLTYDARKLFVATDVNEVGHQRDYFWEYGTGTKLRTDGPNIRTCTNCPAPTTTSPLKEQTTIRVDGLGRTIEFWETGSAEGTTFTLYQKELTSYVDAVTASIPSSVTRQVRQTTDPDSLWTKQQTTLDGLGRPFKITEFVFGTAPNDHVTLFQYRTDGTLQTVSVPDPTQNNASLVAYTYSFDSLGRATSLRRPDAAVIADQSGVDIAYDGTSKTVVEVVGVAGGIPATTKTVSDSFGRLTEVHEQISTKPTVFAVTHYTFGPSDNVVTVVDPENVTTALVHDFAGHRTQIIRHGRTWKYGYDKNGNMISEQVPGSPSPPATDPDYTNTIAYDGIDRVVSKLIGSRGLSGPDQGLFGSRTESFNWDYGGNMTGRLYSWLSYGPSSPTATIIRSTWMNDQGEERKRLLRFIGLAGLSDERSISRKFTLAGQLAEARFGDSLPGGCCYTRINPQSTLAGNFVRSGCRTSTQVQEPP